MIGSLYGRIEQLTAPTILLDVNHVGYEIDTPLTDFCQLQVGQEIRLWTHLVVREDAQQLYGFVALDNRQLFRQLLRVNGIGAKMALAILSTYSAADLAYIVQNDQIKAMTKIPGVGTKTAERLMIELRDKIKNFSNSQSGLSDSLSTSAPNLPLAASNEAEAALLALGYKPNEARQAIDFVKEQHHTTADMIRAALKTMLK